MAKLIAGNWKMNGNKQLAHKLAADIAGGAEGIPHEILLCPPFIHLDIAQQCLQETGAMIKLGGQDCAAENNGAYTGDVSAEMLADIGCSYVILGHSERRHGRGETDNQVQDKARIAIEKGLNIVLCVGETDLERTSGQEKVVVMQQILGSLPENASPENTVLAYEPVWAIGTGKTASLEDTDDMHGFMKNKLSKRGAFRVLYGGSVKPENAAEILGLETVDGALIGGASLDANSFLTIARAI